MKILLRLLLLSLFLVAGFWFFRKNQNPSQNEEASPQASAAPPSSPRREPLGSEAVFVSPTGDQNGDGSREHPFLTIKAALASLPVSGKGTIALLGGVYRDAVSINKTASPSAEVGHLRIVAVPGDEVIFDGGEAITTSEPWQDAPGMYVVKAPDRETTYSESESGYLDVFDPMTRTRYRKQFDADGVRAFPGSVCELDADTILVHTLDGRAPEAVGLWRNRLAQGFTINRSRVTVEGIHFRNYLGGIAARALTVIKEARDVEIQDCLFSNCVRGMSLNGISTHIRGCDFRDVGLGIVTYGIDTQIEDCLLQAALGKFSLGDLNQHLRDGIRFYAPAIGGEVHGCTTAGFWAGLYVKTYTEADNAHPMFFSNNRFLDGIMPGSTGAQPLNSYINNIIGPNDDSVDPMHSPLLTKTTFKGNYFFDGGGSAQNGNLEGPSPFMSLPEGNLTLRPEVTLPERMEGSWAQLTPLHIKWTPAIAALLREQEQKLADSPSTEPLRLLAPPSVTSGRAGALVTVSVNIPAKGVLSYRKVGDEDWRLLRGGVNLPSKPEVVMGVAPIAYPSQPSPFSILFALLDKRLQPETNYEFFFELRADGREPLRTKPQSFITQGGPKQIAVRAGAHDASADGTSEHPFPHLQAALDRALPGDTITMGPGVYTRAAFLSHGGTPDAPLTIQGAGADQSILDSGMEAPVLLELARAEHVQIKNLQFRWFGNAGILANQSPSGLVEKCRFFNARIPNGVSPNGNGIVLNDSPGWTVSGSLFVRMELGIQALRSPRLTLSHNTAFRTMYAAATFIDSTEGSKVIGNSFTFAGNDALSFRESSKKPFATFISDFNNFGSLIQEGETIRPENDFKAAPRYGTQSKSKRIAIVYLGKEMTEFHRMADWQKFTGQDQHSIFADPEYVNPLAVDFRLLPKSPNVLSDGTTIIGAFPIYSKDLP